MNKQISIAEAKNKLTAILHDVENGPPVRLTRHGKPVAVLISTQEYDRLCRRHGNFATALRAFRRKLDKSDVTITEADFEGVRDLSTGREPEF